MIRITLNNTNAILLEIALGVVDPEKANADTSAKIDRLRSDLEGIMQTPENKYSDVTMDTSIAILCRIGTDWLASMMQPGSLQKRTFNLRDEIDEKIAEVDGTWKLFSGRTVWPAKKVTDREIRNLRKYLPDKPPE